MGMLSDCADKLIRRADDYVDVTQRYVEELRAENKALREEVERLKAELEKSEERANELYWEIVNANEYN